ncbi:MAG: hypothetical protein RLZZ628_163 [Bacteroidota bacterium]|jgi:hypothetical protein
MKYNSPPFGLFTLFLAGALSVCSCQYFIHVEPETPVDIFQNIIGNYWVYQYFSTDADGKIAREERYDSTSIVKDTLIRGQKYKITRTFEYKNAEKPQILNVYQAFLRDSSDHIVDERGNLYAWPQKITDTLRRDTIRDYSANGRIIATKSYIYTDRDAHLHSAVGHLETIDLKSTFNFYPNYQQGGNVRYAHTWYSAGIGKVKEIGFGDYRDMNNYGKELIRYYVKK